MLDFVIVYGLTTGLTILLHPLVIINIVGLLLIFGFHLNVRSSLYAIVFFIVLALLMSLFEFFIGKVRETYLESHLSIHYYNFPKEINTKDIWLYFSTFLPSILLLFILIYLVNIIMNSPLKSSLILNIIIAFFCVFTYSLNEFVIIPTFSVNGVQPPKEKLLIIHEAAKSGDIEALTELIEKGENINLYTNKVRAPLHFTILEKRHQATKLLLDAGADVNLEARDFQHKTPLMIAAQLEDKKAVELLLSYGADPHLKLTGDRNVLYYAKTNLAIFDLFVNKGVDFHVLDAYGDSLLTTSAGMNTNEGFGPHPKAKSMVLYLLDKGLPANGLAGEKSNPVLAASQTVNIDVLNVLFDYGANPNVPNRYNETALVTSILKGELEVVELLINRSADVNLKGSSGVYQESTYTPLEAAQFKKEQAWDEKEKPKFEKMIDLLIKAGAK